MDQNHQTGFKCEPRIEMGKKKKEINIGVDFGFWEDRITGNIDYYNRKTEDLLWDYDVPSPPYLFSRMVANAGSMRNQGIEAGITVIPCPNKKISNGRHP